MKFEDYKIDDKIKKALDLMGFRRPTDIQYKCIPNILDQEDLLAIAQTGTGKTGAYAIPISDLIYHHKKRQRRSDGIKCLIMVPTHELAIQVEAVFKKLCKFVDVNILAIYGGTDQDPQIDTLNKGVDILIATPGRMFDLIHQKHLRTNRIETLILDEADLMLDLGFIKDITDIIRHLPKRKQTLFFSATITPYIKKIAYSLIKQNAIRIQISPKDPITKNVDHAVIRVEMDDKRFFLERLISENPKKKIIVFVRTKVRAERVSKAMARVDIPTLCIHSDKEQDERNQIMEAFRKGESLILIATDISARGIDVEDVAFVVNYDLPEQAENYVHRIGRTGRGKKRGLAYSFCAPNEKEYLDKIENYLGSKIQLLDLDKHQYADTLDLIHEKENDYMAVMKKIEDLQKSRKSRKKK